MSRFYQICLIGQRYIDGEKLLLAVFLRCFAGETVPGKSATAWVRAAEITRMLKRLSLLSLILVTLAGLVIAQETAEAGQTITFGNPKAANRIEVFYDLQCGACAPFHLSLKQIVERNPRGVFVIVRHFPLPLHDRAFMASSVAEAAKKQGKGIEMVDMLLQEQSKWSTAQRSFPMIQKYATSLGLDIKKFQKDITSDETILFVLRDISRARRLEVTSTPTAFLNGKQLTYPELQELEKIISKGN